MKKTTALLLVYFIIFSAAAQYKNDNVLFKTIFPQDLCAEMGKQPGYILLDVRSNNEFEDTDNTGRYNLGHFIGAKNIDINEMSKRINEIAAYKNTPVFVYCSHSQRSRRASKMLADSGFKNILNVNGGMTAIRQLPSDVCLQKMLTTKVNYRVVSAKEICNGLPEDRAGIFVLDVRSDSAYNHISGDAKIDAIGYFKGSTHIALADLEKSLDKIPVARQIVIIDQNGDDAPKAAAIVKKKNWNTVAVMLEGIERYLVSDKKALDCKKLQYISPVKYDITNAIELNQFLKTKKPYIFLDIREEDEFNNQAKETWKNIGQIENAVHVPLSTLNNSLATLDNYKNTPIIIYAFGSGKEIFTAANTLTQNGFTNVKVLMGGLFSIRWTAANVKGNADLFKLVTNIPKGGE